MKDSSLKTYDLVDSQTIATQMTQIQKSQRELQEARSHYLKQNLTSIKSSNWILSLITVAVAFAVIPLFPILIAFVVGHWFSKQNK